MECGSQTQPTSIANVPNNISSQPLDAWPNPRFTSHLLPIYVESLAQEQVLELSKSKLDAKHITSAKQAVQKVTVHAWRPHIAEPESCQIQKGFTWPFFKLSLAVLSLVGLQQSVESGTLQMYDELEGYWLMVGIDHVIEVHEGQHVFLRDCSVHKCEQFDKLFKQVSPPHLRNNLPQECAYVRNAWRLLIPTDGLSSSQKCKASSPSNLLPHPVKRECSCSMVPELLSPPSPSLPSASTLFLPSQTSPTPLSVPISAGLADDPIEVSDCDKKKWPRDYFVCDVACCFHDAKTSVHGHCACTAAIIFQEHFPGLTFHLSTYSDNKSIWRQAPQHLKNHYLCASRKEARYWYKFAAAVKEHMKAQSSLSGNVIELSD